MRLRFLFFMTLAGIAVLDREIESVSDKHLVIAKNIGEALERCAVDLKNGFELVAAMPADVRETPAGQIEIEVSDKGAGMPSDEIREVLEPLSQGNRNKARKYEGSGLGLHICSKFMQLHGGTLEIESAVGEGTSATLCFPVERSL